MNLRTCLELIRLPNTFTAMADVAMGYFFVGATLGSAVDGAILGLLLVSSVAFYSLGMVLNDLADAEVDRPTRPERPLPSGRVSPREAWRLAAGLAAAAVSAAGAASVLGKTPAPLAAAVALAAAIVTYDFWPGRGLLAAPMMGVCRMCNVLLGMSAAGFPESNACWIAAGGIGVYVAGVTIFAKQETQQSPRGRLLLGLGVMLGGVALLAWLPEWTVPFHLPAGMWRILMAAFGLVIANRCRAALFDPSPERVQTAVKVGILSLVFLDASICLAVAGPTPAMGIMALLVPALLLGRWFKST